jgi:UDP-glucose 4-epimerase
MKYLITGARGFIGRNLVAELDARGISYATSDSSLFHYNTDTIVHLSAMTDVRQSVAAPEKVYSNNVEGMMEVLEYARHHGMKVIFASSINAQDASNPYLASKASCEALCESYRVAYGLDISILRFSNVYGPYSEYKTSVIPKFIMSVFNKQLFQVYGDGEQTRDFIHVQDVVLSILNASQPLEFISTGFSVSINYILEWLKQYSMEAGLKPVISRVSEVPGEIRDVLAKSSIKPTIPLITGLSLTFDYFKDQIYK